MCVYRKNEKHEPKIRYIPNPGIRCCGFFKLQSLNLEKTGSSITWRNRIIFRYKMCGFSSGKGKCCK